MLRDFSRILSSGLCWPSASVLKFLFQHEQLASSCVSTPCYPSVIDLSAEAEALDRLLESLSEPLQKGELGRCRGGRGCVGGGSGGAAQDWLLVLGAWLRPEVCTVSSQALPGPLSKPHSSAALPALLKVSSDWGFAGLLWLPGEC